MDRHTDVYTCMSEELKCKGRRKVEQSDKPGLHLCRFKAQSWPSLDQGIAKYKKPEAWSVPNTEELGILLSREIGARAAWLLLWPRLVQKAGRHEGHGEQPAQVQGTRESGSYFS